MVASADKMIMRTNRETIAWLKALSSQNLKMRQNLEEATIFLADLLGIIDLLDHGKMVSSENRRRSNLRLNNESGEMLGV